MRWRAAHSATAKKALEDPFFNAEPKCKPSELPEFASMHEYEVRKQRQRNREAAKRGADSSLAEAGRASRQHSEAVQRSLDGLRGKRAKTHE